MNARSIPTVAALLGALLSVQDLAAQTGGDARHARLRMLDSVKIESTEAQPLVRLSGFARSASGWMVLSDLSEGVVRLHRPDGRLSRIIGRRGEGPGEFRAPVLPRFDGKGRLHVPDIGLLRVSVFELPDEGEPRLIRTVPFANSVVALFSFDLRPNGDYLLGGPVAQGRHLLTVVDSLGVIKGRHVEIGHLRRDPVGPRYDPLWQALQVPTVATDGTRIFVTLSTFDSVWVLTPSMGRPVAWSVPIPDYEAPTIPRDPPASRQDIRSWATSQLVTTVFASERWLLIPSFRGTYNEGRASDVLVRPTGAAWSVLRDVPTILAVRGDTVFSLRSIEEPIWIVRQLLSR